MKTKVEHLEESIRLRTHQVKVSLQRIEYDLSMVILARELLKELYEEARIASIVNLCLTGK